MYTANEQPNSYGYPNNKCFTILLNRANQVNRKLTQPPFAIRFISSVDALLIIVRKMFNLFLTKMLQIKRFN